MSTSEERLVRALFSRATRRSRVRALGILAGAVLVAAAVAGFELVQSRGSSSSAGSADVPALVSKSAFQARSGVRLTQVAVTGNGGLLDLRFQVLDPSRAASVHTAPPTLVDERTGVVVDQLFMGHQHRGLMKAGQSYYLIFSNPGNLVQHGSRVTVQLGASRVAHVPVQ